MDRSDEIVKLLTEMRDTQRDHLTLVRKNIEDVAALNAALIARQRSAGRMAMFGLSLMILLAVVLLAAPHIVRLLNQ